MGSPGNEPGRGGDEVEHQVTLSKGFHMQVTEVTNAQWIAVMATDPSTSHSPGANYPVDSVSWFDAVLFANTLSAAEGRSLCYADAQPVANCTGYRLPTEAEWEYAARAGSKGNYWFGDIVGDNEVNCRECGAPWSGIGNAPIGSFKPNPWGLYDMHGNAFEWVQDCWQPNYQDAPKSSRAWEDGECQFRVIRGGSWYYYSRMSRSANRQKNPGAVKSYWLSFRLVREIK